MKVRLCLILLALALLLAACGAESAESAPAPSPVETEAPEETLPPAEGHLLPDLDLEQSQAMARFLNANRALLLDGRLYCYDFGPEWTPVLARYTWTQGTLKGFTVLAEGCIPEYLCSDGEHLFYIDRSSGAIERVPEKGGKRELLREGPCEGLALRDGRLYFRDGEGRFLSIDVDGKDETELLPGPCSFAYPLAGAILYRADKDGGRLHLYREESGADEALTAGPASTPLIFDGRLWYDDGSALCSVDLDLLDEARTELPERDGAVELLPEEAGLSLRVFRDEHGPHQWAGAPEGPFREEARGYRICDWLGGGVRVDTVYEPDGRIRCFLLTDDEGAEISFLAGRTN